MPRQQFGRYEIVRLLGAGAFAAVYEAQDPALDATVAVKVLGDNHCGDPGIRARFINEARLLRRVGTSRLVPVFDIGEQNGQPYFVMELLAGGTLADRMTGGDVPDRATMSLVIGELADCMNAIHRAGIVHRDLKPSNILIRPTGDDSRRHQPDTLITADDRFVLGDFGIARELDASNLTMAVGTKGFMAPEQKTSVASIDQRADIYAATAIIAVLVTSTWNPDLITAAEITALSPDLRAALVRGMAIDPDHRPSDADHWRTTMLQALTDTAPAGPENGRSTPGPVPPTSPTRVSPTRDSPTRDSTDRYSVGRRPRENEPAGENSTDGRPTLVRLIAGGLVALLALAVGGGALLRLWPGDQPQIVGPEVIPVGQIVEYQADVAPGAEHYWTDWDGIRHGGEALQVEPTGPGVLPITLTEVIDGEERTAELVIKVLE